MNLAILMKAQRLYKRVGTFFLSCVDADGYPITKAVVPAKRRESLDEIYFITNTSSKFANAVTNNPKGGVYFYSKILFNYKGCGLKGKFEIVTDMAVKQRYWRNLYKGAYAEKSYTDPDFCVLRFVPTSGRYYANFNIADFKITEVK